MKELKPAFRFLGIFLALYLGLNIIYGFWISAYNPAPDPLTIAVTKQSSAILSLMGEQTTTRVETSSPAISILNSSRVAISVFEGCNGVNVMIVFVSFLFAFGIKQKKNSWFLPMGIAIIYVANLVRVLTLYLVAENWEEFFYYVHKYILTAFLYAIVFFLWWLWIEKVSGIKVRDAMANKQS